MNPEISVNLVENSTTMKIRPSLSIFRFTFANIMENCYRTQRFRWSGDYKEDIYPSTKVKRNVGTKGENKLKKIMFPERHFYLAFK